MKRITSEDARFARAFVDEALEGFEHLMSARMFERLQMRMLVILLTTPSGLVLLDELQRLDSEEDLSS